MYFTNKLHWPENQNDELKQLNQSQVTRLCGLIDTNGASHITFSHVIYCSYKHIE